MSPSSVTRLASAKSDGESLAREQDYVLQVALRRLGREMGLTPVLEDRLVEVAAELKNRDIADRNGITVNTVKTEIRQILRVFDLCCRHQISRAYAKTQSLLTQQSTTQEAKNILQHYLLLD